MASEESYLRKNRFSLRFTGWMIFALRRLMHYMMWVHGWLRLVPRPDDLYIATYPRSGTTWLQMIIYQLTTSGDMSFEHISEVIPFLERSWGMSRDLSALPSPRCFKTHLPYHELALFPGKYIYVMRDGRDVLLSYFHFNVSHLKFKGTFDEFVHAFLQGGVEGGSWFRHVAEWQRHAKDVNVLFLHYEDLVSDFDSCLDKIISFGGWQISSETYERVKTSSTFEYMKRFESKFDFRNEVLWEGGFVNGSFLRMGKPGMGRSKLSREQEDAFARLERGLSSCLASAGTGESVLPLR